MVVVVARMDLEWMVKMVCARVSVEIGERRRLALPNV